MENKISFMVRFTSGCYIRYETLEYIYKSIVEDFMSRADRIKFESSEGTVYLNLNHVACIDGIMVEEVE